MLLVGDGAWGSGDGGAFVLKLAGGFPVCFFRVNFGYDRETASITRCRYAARAIRVDDMISRQVRPLSGRGDERYRGRCADPGLCPTRAKMLFCIIS